MYTQLGSLHVFDMASRSGAAVPVTIAADDAAGDAALDEGRRRHHKREHLAHRRTRGVRNARRDSHGAGASTATCAISPPRLATADRDPAWSPNGRWIAYFSDRTGEYALHLKDQKGLHPARTITLPSPSFFYTPTWSPDSKKIAYTDKHLNLWYVGHRPSDARSSVDTAPYETFGAQTFDAQWSPDSRWLAYNKQLANFLNAIFVYSVGDRHATQITDGMSDSRNPVFDKSGKYLYFLASTNTGLTSNGLDMTSDQHPTSSNLYMAVLQRKTASPIAPETGDEPTDEPTPSPKPSAAPKPAAGAHDVTIDFDGLLQRIVALPVSGANYVGLAAGQAGEAFLLRAPLTTVSRTHRR